MCFAYVLTFFSFISDGLGGGSTQCMRYFRVEIEEYFSAPFEFYDFEKLFLCMASCKFI